MCHRPHYTGKKLVVLSLLFVLALAFVNCLIALAPRLFCQENDLHVLISQKPRFHNFWGVQRSAAATVSVNEPGATSRKRSLPVAWQIHHIFNGSSSGQLHACPSQWPVVLQLWRPQYLVEVSHPDIGDKGSATSAIKQAAARSSAAQHSRHHNPADSAKNEGQGTSLPYTLEALKVVWQHQHPRDCRNAKFITYTASHSGIGSVIHVQSMVLRSALDSGRVMVESPGHFLASTPYCGANNTLGSCYFLPMTNCTLTSTEVSQAPLLSTTEQFLSLLARDPKLPRVVRVQPNGDFLYTFLDNPLIFEGLLSMTSIPKGLLREGASHRLWWWRAVGAAYIVRPNERTYGELAVRARNKLVGEKLKSGCIGLYVRHGDKHTETEVFSDQQYEEAVNKLRSIDPSLTRQVFLSTEDAATVAYYRNASRAWLITYVDMPMKTSNKSNLAYMAETGYHEEMLNGLLNLQLILECSGFVGSMYSNWARLIEELRSTVWCKADSVYFDVKIQAPVGFHYII
jgi:hypothetical protein